MNIYIVTEDGVETILKGETMHEVLTICEIAYVEERTEEEGSEHTKNDYRDFYHDYTLQSCTLIGY